jgi:hypothetical protein
METQLSLFPQSDWAKRFDEWVHSPSGGLAMNRFIRIAIGCRRRGVKLGAKCIWERLRWNFFLRKPEDQQYKLNNNFTAYAARFAVDRAPELADYFEFREVSCIPITKGATTVADKQEDTNEQEKA